MYNIESSIHDWLLPNNTPQLTIDDVASKYPYFQAAILYKLISGSDNNPEILLSSLPITSIILPNRNILIKHYINAVIVYHKKNDKVIDSIESIIQTIQDKLSHITFELVENKPIHKPYTLEVKNTEEPQLSEKQLRKKELMEEFIKKSPSISRNTSTFFTSSESYSKPSIDTENIVSETLALIYAKQGNSEKAKNIYLKLIELHPEKAAFFKSQIDELKND